MVDKLKRRPNKKRSLLDLAAKLVSQNGFEALTIDGLAHVAQITKGGVQYHFASKDSLIAELLQYLLGTLDDALEPFAGRDWLSAYVNFTLGEPNDGDGAVAAILAALPPRDPRCAPFEFYARKWKQQAAESGLDSALAQIIRLAADGQWLERSFGTATAAEMAVTQNALQNLIKGH